MQLQKSLLCPHTAAVVQAFSTKFVPLSLISACVLWYGIGCRNSLFPPSWYTYKLHRMVRYVRSKQSYKYHSSHPSVEHNTWSSCVCETNSFRSMQYLSFCFADGCTKCKADWILQSSNLQCNISGNYWNKCVLLSCTAG